MLEASTAYASTPDEVQLLDQFEEFITNDRGLAQQTAITYLSQVGVFLDSIGGVAAVAALTPADVVRFVSEYASNHSWETCRGMLTSVRRFLRWAHTRGVCLPLAGAVPSVARPKRKPKERAASEKEVEALLAARTRPGRAERDAATVLLIARLGLRSIEVARLELGDLDWSAGTVCVPSKGNDMDRMPLPVDVGEALVEYLRVRSTDSSSRAVFLTVDGSGRALSASGVRHIVRETCGAAGLEPFGPHRLRHALATSLLAQGDSLAHIGQVLRHRSLASTAIYAKSDMQGLAQAAGSWPERGTR